MKLFFFITAFCLVLLRAYFAWSGHGPAKDSNDGTMTISSGDFYEQIKWSGKVILSDDEKSIVSIPPGGYLKFRENDIRMVAESNLRGEISYRLYDGQQDLPLNDSGRHFISAVLKKMIARGYYAQGRAERIFKNGGYRALLIELPNLEMSFIKAPYFNLLLKSDSLSAVELVNAISLIGNAGSDIDRKQLLQQVGPAWLKDSLVSGAWLREVAHLNTDIDKSDLLSRFIEQDSLTAESFDKVLEIASRFNADMDKINLLAKLINKGAVDAARSSKVLEITSHFNSDMDKINLLTRLINRVAVDSAGWNNMLQMANHFNSDMDKQNIYGKLMDTKDISEEQWISVINSAVVQVSDADKSNMLVRIAQKMPRTEKMKTAYLSAAKKINDDAAYGRAVKQIE